MKNIFFQYGSLTLKLDHLNAFKSFKITHGENKEIIDPLKASYMETYAKLQGS